MVRSDVALGSMGPAKDFFEGLEPCPTTGRAYPAGRRCSSRSRPRREPALTASSVLDRVQNAASEAATLPVRGEKGGAGDFASTSSPFWLAHFPGSPRSCEAREAAVIEGAG